MSETFSQSNNYSSDLFNEPSPLALLLAPASSKVDVQTQIDVLLNAQMRLAKNFCLQSPFMNILRKRLIILHRIFYAYMMKFNIRNKSFNKVCKFLF